MKFIKNKMTFGKYNGISLCFINSGYFKWLLGQYWFVDRDDDLVVAVEDEMKKRDREHGHFYEDIVRV